MPAPKPLALHCPPRQVRRPSVADDLKRGIAACLEDAQNNPSPYRDASTALFFLVGWMRERDASLAAGLEAIARIGRD